MFSVIHMKYCLVLYLVNRFIFQNARGSFIKLKNTMCHELTKPMVNKYN